MDKGARFYGLFFNLLKKGGKIRKKDKNLSI